MNENQEDYRGNSKEGKVTMKQIILQQIKKIMDLASNEMRGGYDEETIVIIDGLPQIIKHYVPDGRQTYCNAVLALDSAIVNFLIGADNPKVEKLLGGLDGVKEESDNLYLQYLKELKKKDIDRQEVKYKYFSDKKQIYEDMFRQLMIILKRSGFEDDED